MMEMTSAASVVPNSRPSTPLFGGVTLPDPVSYIARLRQDASRYLSGIIDDAVEFKVMLYITEIAATGKRWGVEQAALDAIFHIKFMDLTQHQFVRSESTIDDVLLICAERVWEVTEGKLNVEDYLKDVEILGTDKRHPRDITEPPGASMVFTLGFQKPCESRYARTYASFREWMDISIAWTLGDSLKETLPSELIEMVVDLVTVSPSIPLRPNAGILQRAAASVPGFDRDVRASIQECREFIPLRLRCATRRQSEVGHRDFFQPLPVRATEGGGVEVDSNTVTRIYARDYVEWASRATVVQKTRTFVEQWNADWAGAVARTTDVYHIYLRGETYPTRMVSSSIGEYFVGPLQVLFFTLTLRC